MGRKAAVATVGNQESESFKSMLDAQRAKLGSKNVFMASDSQELNPGVEIPGFAMRYLLDMNVLPLSKLYGIAGSPMSQKSSFGFEVVRWIQNAGGYGSLIEAEGKKYSEDLIRSIIGEEAFDNRFAVAPVQTIDEAQLALSAALSHYEATGTKTFLSALMLDSLTGVDTAAVGEKTIKQGHSSSNPASMARAWSDYFRFFSSQMSQHPFVFLVINHLKDKINMGGMPTYGPPQKTTPGGDSQLFHASVYLYLSRESAKIEKRQYRYIGGEKTDCDENVASIKIFNRKSSLGVHGRSISVEFVWEHDSEGRQKSYFDWDSATCKLLLELQDEKSSAFQYAKLKDLLDITEGKTGNRTTYSSEKLGLTGSEEYEIGKAIHNSPEMFSLVQKFFHIKQRPIWNGKLPELNTKKKKVEVVEEVKEKSNG
jgi:RecA/RadA recombinase